MRPYLAIIKDSFRAAMASRVLYVLLMLITLLLLVFLPLHQRQTLDWELRERGSVLAPGKLLRRIVEDRETEKPVGRIWEELPPSMRKKMLAIIRRSADGDDAPEIPGMPASIMDAAVYEQLVSELNKIIKDPEFYRPEDWVGVSLPREADELIDAGVEGLSKTRSRRLNRLLVATAVSPEIELGTATAIGFYYAGWETPLGPLSMTHEQFAQVMTSGLPWFFDKFVMSIGLLIAVLVTANMIPETFQSGSLNLLLSKPISRWGLYLAKFVGGCVFVALCATYLFVGVWAWLGMAMGIWDRSILLSIPLYVIVFAIYFSVSALVGLIWRSAIVSVILTLLFWAFCFFIGFAYSRFDTRMDNTKMIGLLPVGEKVVAIDSLHQLNVWDASNDQWDSKLNAQLGDQGKMIVGINSFMQPLSKHPATAGLKSFLAPVYDRQHSQVIASRYEMNQALAAGKKSMLVSGADAMDFNKIGEFPRDTIELFDTPQGIIAATSSGSFYRMNQQSVEQAIARNEENQSRKKSDDNEESDIDSVPGDSDLADSDLADSDSPESDLSDDPPDSDSPEARAASEDTSDVNDSKESETKKVELELFDRVGPDAPVAFRSAGLVAYSRERDEFVSYRMGVVTLFRTLDETYQVYGSLPIHLGFSEIMSCQMAYQGNLIVLAFGNGRVFTIDGEVLNELDEYQLESRSGIRDVAGSSNGRYFGVLYRNGNLWLLDRENDHQFTQAPVTGQGGIASFAFGEDDQLWVTDDTDRVSSYSLSDGSTHVRHVPNGAFVAKFYRYGIRPFYRICPKPGEFYKVVPLLSSSGNSKSNENVDLNFATESSDPWSPLLSGLAFMMLMLMLGCIVFQFKDY